MPSFEANITRAFNEWFDKKKIAAMSYKLPMVRYQKQGFDIYCDSRHYEWYCAIECKSIDAEAERALYFSQYFHVSKGVHQLEYENSISERSGRNTFLAVERRRSKGVRKAAFLVPWRIVFDAFKRGFVGLEPEQITECCELEWYSGGYHFNDEIEEVYLNQCSGKPIKKESQKTEARDWYTTRLYNKKQGDTKNELN